MALELAEPFHGDLRAHPLHPALLDVATAGAPFLIEGNEAGAELYIPASYGSVRAVAPLGPSLLSHIRYRGGERRGMAIFDVTLFDPEGRVAVSIDEFVMVRVADPDAFAREAAEAAGAGGEGAGHGPPVLAEGLSTADGVRALDRILRGPPPPRVVAVVPRNLAALLREAGDGPAGGSAGSVRPREEVPDVDVEPVVAALRAHPAVADAAAVAHAHGGGSARVVAFVVYAAAERATVSELRRSLRDRLAEALVPGNFVEMTAIPRGPDGTVDRTRLPDPFAPVDDYVAPRTATETIIADIWRRLLGLERVGVHDNFLDVGGHSLVGIRALLQIEKRTGVRLHPNVLTLQTLEQLAAECDRRAGEAGGPDGDGPREGIAGRILSAVRQSVGGGS